MSLVSLHWVFGSKAQHNFVSSSVGLIYNA